MIINIDNQFKDNWLIFSASIFAVITLIILSEFFFNRKKTTSNFNRKLIHILVGCFASFSPLFFSSNLPSIILALIFILVDMVNVKYKLYKSMESINKLSLGTIFFPVSYLIFSLFFWNYTEFFILSFLILSIADPLASIIGENLKEPKVYRVWIDKKSIEGTITFFTTSFLILYFGSFILFPYPLGYIFCFSFFIATFATIAELISAKGSDNISIPVISILLMIAFDFRFSGTMQINQIIGSVYFFMLLILILLLYIFLRFEALSSSGFLGAVLMGVILIMLTNIRYLLLLAVFFTLCSIISKLIKKKDFISTKGSKRDVIQVYANGGISLLICLYDYFYPSSLNILLFSSSVAAAMSDTWATEFGKLSKSKPRSIISLTTINHGESGGITFIGTFGSFLGSTIVGYSAFLLFSISFIDVLGIILSGFFAALIDSILGATLQGKYKLIESKKIIEVENKNSTHFSGYKWMNNDVVNLINTFVSPLIFLIFYVVII